MSVIGSGASHPLGTTKPRPAFANLFERLFAHPPFGVVDRNFDAAVRQRQSNPSSNSARTTSDSARFPSSTIRDETEFTNCLDQIKVERVVFNALALGTACRLNLRLWRSFAIASGEVDPPYQLQLCSCCRSMRIINGRQLSFSQCIEKCRIVLIGRQRRAKLLCSRIILQSFATKM